MARRKVKDPPTLISWRIHIAKDSKGTLLVTGYSDNGSIRWIGEGTMLKEIAIIDAGRPLRYHSPSSGSERSPGDHVNGARAGLHGIVFEDMTGDNALPWTPSQILAAAQHRMFGFTIVG